MKAFMLLLLVAAALSASQGRDLTQDDEPLMFIDEVGGGEPLGSVSTSCSAFSFLQILATGGTCTGSSSADCVAIADAQNAFVEVYEDWWVGDDGNVDGEKVCQSELVQVAAEAIATAIAKVWTTAFVKVTCEGQGFACGWAVGNGEAFAIAFAEAIATAAADVSMDNVEAFCVADIRAIAGALAEAAESARADTCTTGGTEVDFESSYASAVVDAIASAFASATASACGADDSAKAQSECFGTASSIAEMELEGEGAAGEQVIACEGGKAECCTERFAGRRFCGCTECNGPLRLQTDDSGDGRVSWQDQSGEICFCV